jgi:hypothetical protein
MPADPLLSLPECEVTPVTLALRALCNEAAKSFEAPCELEADFSYCGHEALIYVNPKGKRGDHSADRAMFLGFIYFKDESFINLEAVVWGNPSALLSLADKNSKGPNMHGVLAAAVLTGRKAN